MFIYNMFLFTVIAILVVFSGRSLIQKEFQIIKKHIALRKEILKRFENESLLTKEDSSSANNFNRGIFEKRKTVPEKDYKRKIEIIESINPYLMKDIGTFIIVMAIFTFNIMIFKFAFLEFSFSYEYILEIITVMFLLISILGTLLKKTYLNFFIIGIAALAGKAVLLYALIGLTVRSIKK